MNPPLQRSADAPLVRAQGIGVRRGGRWLIRNVDLSIHRGRIVSLIGPNGGGKTTTARTLLGIEKATAGRVERLPGVRIGYVPQRLAIDWTLPLAVRHLMTLTRPHDPALVMRMLDEVGVAHLIDAPVQTLSGGEFQRVLLARALIAEPDLLILDEPVQGVDFNGEVALYRLIREIRDRLNCGILLVSHDLHVVMAETDVVVCLNGHVCCSGPPETVAGSSEFHHLFGPRAAQAIAFYRHHHDHGHGLDGTVVALDPARARGSGGAHGHGHEHDHGHDHGSAGA